MIYIKEFNIQQKQTDPNKAMQDLPVLNNADYGTLEYLHLIIEIIVLMTCTLVKTFII